MLTDDYIETEPPPDLFKLITYQANVRMNLEKKWLEKYVEYLEIEDEKRKEEEKKWKAEHNRVEAEKREKAKKKRAIEKSRTKVIVFMYREFFRC